MLYRLIFHVSVLTALSALGVWAIHLDLLPAHQGGFSALDGLGAAMYWFALLVYALLSSLAYVVLRRRSFQSLIIAHLFSAGIGTLCAVGVVILGQKHAEEVRLSNPSTSTNDLGTPRQATAIEESGSSSPTAPPVIPE